MEYIFGALIGIVFTYIFTCYVQVNGRKSSEKPTAAAKVILKNKDPRFPSSRFTKMEYILITPQHPRIRVLFQFDRESGERYDVKIVSSKRGPNSDSALQAIL